MVRKFFGIALLAGLLAWVAGPSARLAQAEEKPKDKPSVEKDKKDKAHAEKPRPDKKPGPSHQRGPAPPRRWEPGMPKHLPFGGPPGRAWRGPGPMAFGPRPSGWQPWGPWARGPVAPPAGPGAWRPNPEAMFDRLDTNKDGSLSKEEFVAGMKALHQRLQAARGPRFGPPGPSRMAPPATRRPLGPPAAGPRPGTPGMYRAFGPPRPGAAMGAGPRTPPEPPNLVARWDKNKDGKLTKDEVPERAWQFLSKADADNDGAVTPEELQSAREKFQRRRGEQQK